MLAQTTVLVTLTEAESEALVAVNTALPYMIGYPFLKI